MNSDIVILSDRIKELSHTKGQGAFVLDGELAGFSPFGDYYQYGDVVYYAATDGTNYEVGSGEYRQNGSDNELTRFPLRSTALNSGPYYLDGESASGPTEGQEGYFYPLFLTKSAAMNVAGATSVHEHTFSGYHGVTFYMPNNHNGHAEASAASATGVDYVASGQPFNFPDFGIKEVYVTYPGKYSVFTGYGISGYREPRMSGVAFWGSEQLLNYDADMMWSDDRANLGISQTNPQFAIDVGGDRGYSQIRASGFFGGGSGVFFSGGQPLPQDNTKTASGGRQLEPFFRNELDNTTGTDAIFFLSGIVNERICSLKQEKGTIYAGPASGCEDVGCSPDYPTFRYLTLEDIPDLSSLYVVQDKAMVGIDPATLPEGTISLYKESGVITYRAGFIYTGGKLGLGTTAPNFALDVFDGSAGVSGNVIVSGDIYTKYGGNIHSSGGVFARTDSYFGNDVTVSGDLYVKGNTTYIDSTNVAVHDKQIELASLSGNAIHDDMDSMVDDGGMLVRSSGNGVVDTGDKKWTWRSVSNTWTAATSNGEKLGITASGMIFNDGSAISGAYRAGSGLSLLEGGQTFAIGNMFKVGAIDSGNAGSDGNYVTDFVHQADEVGFSGAQGLSVYSSGTSNNVLEILVDPSVLSGVLSYGFLASNGSGSPDPITNEHTVFWSGVQGLDVHYDAFSNSGLFTIDPSGLSGTLSSRDTIISGVLQYGINNAAGGYTGFKLHSPGVAIDNIANAEVLTISGVSGIDIQYTASSNDLKFSASGLSGVLQGKIDGVSGAVVNSGNFLLDTIVDSGVLVSGFALNYTNASGNFLLDTINASGMNISGVLGYTLNNLTTSNIAATTLVTSSEGIASNDNDTTIPTSAAVKAYADSVGGGFGGSYAGFSLNIDNSTVNTIGSSESVTISGQSGINASMNYFTNTILLDPLPLSGTLQYAIDNAGGGYAGFKVHDPEGAIDTIASNELLTVSGVSGVVTNYIPSTNNLIISPDALSGVLQGKIDGVSGMAVDSGILVSGFALDYTNASGNFLLDTINSSGNILSGVLQGSGNFLLDAINASGAAVSGLSYNADVALSGYIEGVADPTEGGSGLIREPSTNTMHMDIYGSGQLSHLIFNDNLIRLGSGAALSSLDTVPFSTSVGRYALAFSSGEYPIAIGDFAGTASSGHEYSVMIGKEAGIASSGLIRAVMIGYEAGSNASGTADSMYDSVFVGRGAGRNAYVSHSNTLIGANAGGGAGTKEPYDLRATTVLGANALSQSKSVNNTIAIGSSTAFDIDDSSTDIAIGHLAMSAASGTSKNVAIGRYASIFSENDLQNIILGDEAGYARSGLVGASVVNNTLNVILGANAGRDGQGAGNVLLGFYAGAYDNLSKSIIIQAEDSKTSALTATDWINKGAGTEDEYSLVLGKGIFGSNTSTRLGKRPSTASDFSSTMLNVAKDSNAKIGIKTEMHTTSDVSDQIQASTDDAGHANTIVNSHGYLQVAVAKNKTGSGASAQLFTHATDTSAKYEISRKEGTMAWYARHHSNDWRMYVYVNGRWREEGTGGGTL